LKDIVGLLLAAGSAKRFGSNKLLHLLPHGVPIAVQAARHLKPEVDRVFAVVRSQSDLSEQLKREDCEIVVCEQADEGMGASLACAVQATADATGWLVALADMPWISAATIERVGAAVTAGAPVAAPFYRGERGHPVGFSASCYSALAALTGDEGAKAIVGAHRDRMVRIDVADAGILRDVDTPADLS